MRLNSRSEQLSAALSSTIRGKIMINKIVVVLSMLAASLTADGAEVGGVKIDDKATLGGRELILTGAGTRTRLVIKVYVAALYLPQKATTAAAVLAKDE